MPLHNKKLMNIAVNPELFAEKNVQEIKKLFQSRTGCVKGKTFSVFCVDLSFLFDCILSDKQ